MRPSLLITALLALTVAACGGGDGDDEDRARPDAAPGPALAAPADKPYAAPVATAEAGEDTGGDPPRATRGRVVAELGFDTRRDGFSFENFGVSIGGPEMRVEEMRELFGDRVCSPASPDGECTLTPEAANWLRMANTAFYGGHCYGFALLSLGIFSGAEEESAYGDSPTTYGLKLTTPRGLVTNQELHADLARAASTQFVPQVQRDARFLDAKGLLRVLRRTMPQRRGAVLSIFNPTGDGGHGVVPIAVEDLGGGQFDVVVYDNNWPYDPERPGADDRRLRIDTKRNRWSYNASLNPDAEAAEYFGEGKENPVMITFEQEQRLPLECSFCAGAQGRTEVSLSGDAAEHGHLRITDAKGRVTGYEDGRLVNEIPGAEVVQAALNQVWLAEPEPRYSLPAGRTYTVELVDVPAGADPHAIHATGPDLGVGLTGLGDAAEGTKLTLGPKGSVALAPSGPNAVTGSLTVGAPGDRELRIAPSGARLSLRRAGGDVVLKGRAEKVRVVDAARERAATGRKRSGRLDLDALVG